MRLLLFVLSLIVSSVSLAAKPIFGTVVRDATGVYLIGDSDVKCKRYAVETKSDDAALIFRKLSSGDSITASGLLDGDTCLAIIETVDYVGLKRLLGYWFSEQGIITVRDFSSLSFYPINMNDFQNSQKYKEIDPITYRYSVTPSDGKEWVIFLSDSNSTMFATILINSRNKATMKIYDSESGLIKKTLRLSRWGNVK